MKRFLRPPLYILIPLDVLAAVLLACSFLYQDFFTILCYPVYVLSFIMLVLTSVRVPSAVKGVMGIRKYIPGERLRLLCSLIFNMSYSVFLVISWLLTGIYWYLAAAVFYLVLSMLKLHIYRSEDGRRILRSVLLVLTLLDICIIAMVFLTAGERADRKTSDIFAITMALYTFVFLTVSIVSLVRERKLTDQVRAGRRFISLTSAVISMINLENTLINTFSEGREGSFRYLMVTLSGLAFTVALAVVRFLLLLKLKRDREESGDALS